MVNNYPFVTALLVTRNEEEYIEKSLLSLINQTYNKDNYEIIVVDGISADSTVSIIREIIDEYKTEMLKITLLFNEQHTLASGWNIGIKAAKGEYVVRIDAHAEASPDFIEKNIETMLTHDAVCVGCRLITKSVGSDTTVPKILSSPFGVGNSTFRVSEKAGYADTAVYGLYKKSVFDELGYFNEKFKRNQDIEFHSRIRKNGGKFYFNPEISCTYYARSSVKKMLKQAYENGKWNMALMKKDLSALSLRHIIPFLFVVYLFFSIICGIIYKPIWIIMFGVLLLHFTLGLIASTKKTKDFREIIKMPFLFFALHICYGAGYFPGFFIRA